MKHGFFKTLFIKAATPVIIKAFRRLDEELLPAEKRAADLRRQLTEGIAERQRTYLKLQKLRKEVAENRAKSGVVESVSKDIEAEAIEALVSLGFTKTIAKQKIDEILVYHSNLDLEGLIAKALKLGK